MLHAFIYPRDTKEEPKKKLSELENMNESHLVSYTAKDVEP